jgi:hypothetical protein
MSEKLSLARFKLSKEEVAEVREWSLKQGIMRPTAYYKIFKLGLELVKQLTK